MEDHMRQNGELENDDESWQAPFNCFIENLWPLLNYEERCNLSLANKEILSLARKRAIRKRSYYVTRTLARHLKESGQSLLGCYPIIEDLTLKVDLDRMEEEDGEDVTWDQVDECLADVAARLGSCSRLEALTIDGNRLCAASAASLLSELPQLRRLSVRNSSGVQDLSVLFRFTELTHLHAHAHALEAPPEGFALLPLLRGRLEHLALDGLELQDCRLEADLCQALSQLSCLTHLEIFSLTPRLQPSRRVLAPETLRPVAFAHAGPSFAQLTQLRTLIVTDDAFSISSSNELLTFLTELPHLDKLHLPEARVKTSGWKALQRMTSLKDLHVYSIELSSKNTSPMIRAAAAGSVSWRRLRLEDAKPQELAVIMPIRDLELFDAVIVLQYQEPLDDPASRSRRTVARDFQGLEKVIKCLADVAQVRLWLEVDSDLWKVISTGLRMLQGLTDLVVRTFEPHLLQPSDLACLCAATLRLRSLDLFGSRLGDQALAPVMKLPELRKLCLGYPEVSVPRPEEGYSVAGLRAMACHMAAQLAALGGAGLLAAPSASDEELEELSSWLEEQGCPGAAQLQLSNSRDFFARFEI